MYLFGLSHGHPLTCLVVRLSPTRQEKQLSPIQASIQQHVSSAPYRQPRRTTMTEFVVHPESSLLTVCLKSKEVLLLESCPILFCSTMMSRSYVYKQVNDIGTGSVLHALLSKVGWIISLPFNSELTRCVQSTWALKLERLWRHFMLEGLSADGRIKSRTTKAMELWEQHHYQHTTLLSFLRSWSTTILEE